MLSVAGLGLAEIGAREASTPSGAQGLETATTRDGAAHGQAPRVVEVGDGVVDGSFIEPYTIAWRMTFTTPDGASSPAGRWTDRVEIVDERGRGVLRRTQETYAPDGSLRNTQTHVVDHRTMAPIRSHTAAGDRVSHLDYDGARVRGAIIQGPHTAAIVVDGAIDAPAYDWNIFGTLLTAFPLSTGYAARFPHFALTPGEMGPAGPTSVNVERHFAEFEVIDRERITAGGMGEVDAWVARSTQGPTTSTFWLRKAPPYIIRLVSESSRGVMSWEME